MSLPHPNCRCGRCPMTPHLRKMNAVQQWTVFLFEEPLCVKACVVCVCVRAVCNVCYEACKLLCRRGKHMKTCTDCLPHIGALNLGTV